MINDNTEQVKHEKREPLIPEIRVTPHQRRRIVLVAVGILALLWLLVNSMEALGPFIFALVLGYLMSPLISLLDRFLPRALSILLVYAIFLGLIVGISLWIAPLIGAQVDQLISQSPQYYKRAQEATSHLADWYKALPLTQEIRNSIESSLRNSLSAVGMAVQQGATGVLRFLTQTVGFLFGVFIVPFWLFYVLKDKDKALNTFNNILPRSWHADVWRIVRIVNGVLSSYIRGQLLLGLVVGVATTVGMIIVGAPYAVLLGIISGLTEVIPVIGPILGALPGIGIAAFSGEGWVLILKVVFVYLIVQQLENNLLVPKIQGDSVKLHPALILIALVVGSQVGGFVGLVVAVPLAAIARDVYLYLFRRWAEDYSPREAEASVPSRHEDLADQHKLHDDSKLSQAGLS